MRQSAKAIAAGGNVVWGATTSSGEEDRKTMSLEAENQELRARIDALGKKGRGRSARRAEYPFKERRRF